jgi:hypothetical protein
MSSKKVVFLTDNVVANIVNVHVDDHYDEFIKSIMSDEHHSYLTEDMADLTMASIGYEWDGTVIRHPSPYLSWTWNSITKEWQAPVAHLETPDTLVRWDEATLSWIEGHQDETQESTTTTP